MENNMILYDSYRITQELIDEAYEYAVLSRRYTSNRHDFHAGGLGNKQKKMFEGKLGEKGFKMFLLDNSIEFTEDHSSYEERDEYDFLLSIDGYDVKIDVKTRTEAFHVRTLEMVEQAQSHPKDIYVSARLFRDTNTVKLLGWFSFNDMMRVNRIENQGYLDNYVMYDSDLRPMSQLYDTYLIKCKKQ